MKQEVGHGIIGDVNIGPPIVVVVSETGAHSEIRNRNSGSRGRVRERAVSIISVKPVASGSRLLFIGKRAAIDQENIRPSVAVVVEEESPGTHGFRHELLRRGAV